MLIGVDGAMLSMVDQYLAEGSMPALAGLLNGGTSVEALPSIPVDTPTNWTTIATGAEPVNHGINSFIAKWAGEELTMQDTERARSMQSTTSKAELLWETVGRHGGSSVVVNYPVGWPPKGDGVRIIGGDTPGGMIWHKTGEELYAQGPARDAVLELHGVTIDPTPLSFRRAGPWPAAAGSDPESAFLPVSGHEPAGFWANRRLVDGEVRLALSRDEASGLRARPPGSDAVYSALGSPAWRRLVLLAIPSAVPNVLTGVRITASTVFLAALTAEWLMGTKGLGFLFSTSRASFENSEAWGAIVIAVVFAVGTYQLASALERWGRERWT